MPFHFIFLLATSLNRSRGLPWLEVSMLVILSPHKKIPYLSQMPHHKNMQGLYLELTYCTYRFFIYTVGLTKQPLSMYTLHFVWQIHGGYSTASLAVYQRLHWLYPTYRSVPCQPEWTKLLHWTKFSLLIFISESKGRSFSAVWAVMSLSSVKNISFLYKCTFSFGFGFEVGHIKQICVVSVYKLPPQYS